MVTAYIGFAISKRKIVPCMNKKAAIVYHYPYADIIIFQYQFSGVFMKSLIFFVILFTAYSFPQDEYTGTWQGKLAIQNVELRLVLRIISDGDSLKAFLDSPDQGAKDIPVSALTINDTLIRADVAVIQGYYEGALNRDSMLINGNWVQGGMTLPLVLRKTDKFEEVKRPQTPEPPFPYKDEEVFFENKEAGVTLAGTFSYPEKGENFPAVVLITGSGMQDRDETLLNHKPFLVLSDYLTREGIAVLRYDDRGGGKSTGDFTTATTMDFAGDAIAAVNYLMTRKEVDKNNIGLAGHSEGGLVAPLAANRNENISFIVLMAGPGISGEEILIKQHRLISQAEGQSTDNIEKDIKTSESIYKLLKTEKDTAILRNEIRAILNQAYYELTEEEKKKVPDPAVMIDMQVRQLTSPWFIHFVNYDPYHELVKLQVPVLAIVGENDLQVPAKENLDAIERALKEGGNRNYKLVEMPGLNHLFQSSETGSPAEYARIEETFSPDAMKVITEWIKSVTR
jgi:uncharacterized protein